MNLNNYHFEELSKQVNVSENLLRKWKNEVHKPGGENFNPLKYNTNLRNQILSNELEDIMIQFIIKEYIKPGYYLDNRICRGVCLRIWRLRARGPDRQVQFKCSKSWITRFMKKYGYNLRKAHAKRRPGSSAQFKKEAIQYLNAMRDIYKFHKDNNTLFNLCNCDETQWKFCYRGMMTYAKIGSDEVSIKDPFDDKSSITAMATVTADVDQPKLPIFTILKGKTEKVYNELKDIQNKIGQSFSLSGWSTLGVMVYYFKWLKITHKEVYHNKPQYDENAKIDLVLDLYPTHRTDLIKRIAIAYGIDLHYIPAGATDLLQPLDRKVFGPMKRTAHRIWAENYAQKRIELQNNPDKDRLLRQFSSKKAAVRLLVQIWEEMDKNIILKGWDIYTEEFNEDILQSIDENTDEITYTEVSNNELNKVPDDIDDIDEDELDVSAEGTVRHEEGNIEGSAAEGTVRHEEGNIEGSAVLKEVPQKVLSAMKKAILKEVSQKVKRCLNMYQFLMMRS